MNSVKVLNGKAEGRPCIFSYAYRSDLTVTKQLSILCMIHSYYDTRYVHVLESYYFLRIITPSGCLKLNHRYTVH